MNRKGFTLIELMGVITILAILAIIIVPLVDKNVKESKENIYAIQIENIRMAGEDYYVDNILLRPDVGYYSFISLDNLINLGYLNNVKNPLTGDNFDDDVYVQLFNKNGRYIYSVCPYEDDCLVYNE